MPTPDPKAIDDHWENAYLPASEMKVPANFFAAVDDMLKVRRFYQALNKSNRYRTVGFNKGKNA
jgi:uncharacterized protein YdeI (YjbR/CyaY-like superfamily)